MCPTSTSKNSPQHPLSYTNQINKKQNFLIEYFKDKCICLGNVGPIYHDVNSVITRVLFLLIVVLVDSCDPPWTLLMKLLTLLEPNFFLCYLQRKAIGVDSNNLHDRNCGFWGTMLSCWWSRWALLKRNWAFSCSKCLETDGNGRYHNGEKEIGEFYFELANALIFEWINTNFGAPQHVLLQKNCMSCYFLCCVVGLWCMRSPHNFLQESTTTL